MNAGRNGAGDIHLHSNGPSAVRNAAVSLFTFGQYDKTVYGIAGTANGAEFFVPEPATLTLLRLAGRHGVQAEAEMTHKLTGREVYDALCVQGQGDIGEYKAGISSTWIDGKVCFDALALRLNEIMVANGNHDAVVRAITGED